MTNKIEVIVTPKSLVTRADETVEASVKLHNLGQSIDQLNINIEGLNGSWYTLPVSSVALFPNDKDELKIVFSPPKTEKIKAGSYPFRLKVSSQASPEESVTVDMAIAVQTMPDLEISISPQSITGRRGVYRMTINNPEDNEVQLNLQVSDTNGSLQYHLQPENLKISAKSHSQATLEVSLEWLSFFGGDKELSFQVIATSPGVEEGKTIEGKLVRTLWYKMIPQIRLPRIKLPRILVSRFQRPPGINTFQSKTDDKTVFKLTWSVKRSTEVKLNDEVVQPQGERILSPTVSTRYVLTAINKYGNTQKTVEVEPRMIPKAKTSERIRASLSSTHLRLPMGGYPEVTTLQLQNLGEIVDKFLIEVEGIETDWYSRSASSLALMPQTTEQMQISFQIPKKKGAKARIYPFAIIIRSQTTPDDVTIINGNIEVLPLVDYKLKIAPYRVSCRRKGTFRIGLTNTGTSDARINLEATDLDEGLKFKFKNKELVLSAWDSIELPVIAKPKKGGLIGEKKRYDITITAHEASGNSKTANCELYHNPFVGSWKTIFRAIRILIFIAIIGTLIGFIIHWGGGFKSLRTSPQTWWNQLVDKIVNTFSSWFTK
jgi:uncharacterized membrane protein